MSQQGMSERGICPRCGDLKDVGEQLCRKCAGRRPTLAEARLELDYAEDRVARRTRCGDCSPNSRACEACWQDIRHIATTAKLVAALERLPAEYCVADKLTREWLTYVSEIEMVLDEGESRNALRSVRELRARMQSRLAGAA